MVTIVVVMLSVIVPSVVMQSVVMSSVMAPTKRVVQHTCVKSISFKSYLCLKLMEAMVVAGKGCNVRKRSCLSDIV
jgi:hypothetical protein